MILVDPSARPVIGHRGAAAHAPENTLAGFQRGLDLGAEALEFDLRRSADGEAVVCHDSTLDRTTDRSGPVASRTVAQLREVDAGFRFTADGGRTFPFRGQRIGIPTLREVVTTWPGVPLLIEIKEAAVQEAAARVLRETGAARRAVVAGADWRALAAFREPPFTLGASRRDITRLKFRLGRPDPACRSYAVPDSYHGLPIPTRGFVRRAAHLGATVHVWTVDEAATAVRLWGVGVNGIVSNRPEVVRAARGPWPTGHGP